MIRKFIPSSLLLILLLFGGLSTVFAQSGTVKGVITDASNGSPLPGATVVVKGTLTGTVADMNGKYSITVKPGATLVYSYIGYVSQEKQVQPNTTVNVHLRPTAANLNELVVIGYGTEKKKDATGAVAVVNDTKFNKTANANPMDLLVGKVPGVSITTNGGAPGAGATIRIRGGSSLSASNAPLIVVDGVPLSNEGVAGMRNPLNAINPENIASFTILKDASATAIYGSRASNGVIIITTKTGRIGESLTINYSSKFSYYNVPRLISVYDAKKFKSLIETRYAGQSNVLGLLGNSNTNWQNEIFRNTIGTNQFVSVSGAYKKIPFRFSAGYTNQNGILITGNLQRTTLTAALTPTFFNNSLKVSLNVNGSFVKNKFADQGAIGAAIQMDPTQPVYSNKVYTVHYTNTFNLPQTTSTNYGGYFTRVQSNGMPVTLATTNPVALLNLTDNTSKVNGVIGNLKLDYTFPIEGLSAHTNMAIDHSYSKGSLVIPQYASWKYDPVHGGGTLNNYTQEKKNDLFDFYMNYEKDLNSIGSHINVMAGYSWQHFWLKNYSLNGNYTHDYNMDTINAPTENYLVSFFGRVNYSYKNRYLLTFTLRDDGTSRFSPSTRWGIFPAVAFAWRVIDEPWMKSNKLFSQLKLRLGYGVTGQQNINQGNYPYLARYEFSQRNAMYQFGNLFYLTLRPQGYDANIKWESTATYNAGLDYGFLEDRIYGSLNVYYRKTTDLLNYIPVPAGSNLTNYLLTNIGDMENRGVEFSIFGRAIAKKDMHWSIGFNVALNRNKITKLTATNDPNYLGVQVGGISGGVGNTVQIHSVGYPAYSFFVYQQVYDTKGKPIPGLYVDRNGDGIITNADRYHYHDPSPAVTFGLSSDFNYKSWTFSFSGRANLGNYVYNNVSSMNGVYRRLYRPEGPYLSNITTSVTNTNFVNPHYLSDYYVQNASFFRMDYVTLGYTFPNLNKNKDGAPINLKLSLTLNNAFVITNYKGLDPEVFGGIDNNVYPRPRVLVFGLNLQF